MDINRPDVLAEVTAACDRYEAALQSNDVATLGELFWDDARVLRYGPAENLYGHEEIAGFRAARSPLNLARTVLRRVITTFGERNATSNLEFLRPPRDEDWPPEPGLGENAFRMEGGRSPHQLHRGEETVTAVPIETVVK